MVHIKPELLSNFFNKVPAKIYEDFYMCEYDVVSWCFPLNTSATTVVYMYFSNEP